MEYKNVPNIITGKDLDYLKDAFNWNYIYYKDLSNDYKSIKDESLKKIVNSILEILRKNMIEILTILKG